MIVDALRKMLQLFYERNLFVTFAMTTAAVAVAAVEMRKGEEYREVLLSLT